MRDMHNDTAPPACTRQHARDAHAVRTEQAGRPDGQRRQAAAAAFVAGEVGHHHCLFRCHDIRMRCSNTKYSFFFLEYTMMCVRAHSCVNACTCCICARAGAKAGAAGGKTDTIHKAVLMHGPPGIGKSSSARVVIESCGYTMVELNARHVLP